MVTNLIAKKSKPLTYGEFIKQFLETCNLSWLKKKKKKKRIFLKYALVIGESTGSTDMS